jgi:membrane protease YdiL (CAAX protease family)
MGFYSAEQSRKSLPFLYLMIVPASLALVFIYKRFDLFTNHSLWYLLPVWVLCAHLLCGLAHMITSLSFKRGLICILNSFFVYGKEWSPAHLQVAFLTSLLEEVIFRYVLFSVLLGWFNNLFVAGFLVSVAFALFHCRYGFTIQSSLRYFDFFVFSLLLCTLNFATASFYPAFIIHGMRNYILRILLVPKPVFAPPATNTQDSRR